jgi:hypothetical protein
MNLSNQKGGCLMNQEFAVNDVVIFKNKSSKTTFKARIKERISISEYIVEILECDTPRFIGKVTEIDFDAKHNSGRIEFIAVNKFEDVLAEDQAAFYLGLCHLAVDTDDRTWFNECFAQYTLWKEQAKNEKPEQTEGI